MKTRANGAVVPLPRNWLQRMALTPTAKPSSAEAAVVLTALRRPG